LKVRELTYLHAIREAILEEMQRDERVIVMGEDVGRYGGGFTCTKGLFEAFGPERVRDTPISEDGFVGVAVGAAIAGLKPVVEVMFAGFMPLCMNQIINHASIFRYVSGGQLKVPIVIRTPVCLGMGAGAQHSLSPIAWFVHTPGLKVMAPSTPYDVKGLLKSAIRGEDPVISFEHVQLYRKWNKGPVPEEEYLIPLGKADIKREGDDVTIIAISLMVHKALEAANELAKNGISAEVIDPRTLAPLDKQTIVNSVKKTGRAVIVETDTKTCGIGAELAAIIVEEAFDRLDAPIKRIATPDIPVPVSVELEKHMYPSSEDIARAAMEII
jgi:pyruvate/2-oxoglutarate/acetoin dehydrogenase E1 component